MVPVVPAADSVWQLAQPPEPTKIALPAAALLADDEPEEDDEPLGVDELPELPGMPGWAALAGGG
jgi:hypothetical protein